MSDKKVIMLKDVKAAADACGYYNNDIRMDARRAWWSHCEAARTPSVPTFRQFWNDEATYPLIA